MPENTKTLAVYCWSPHVQAEGVNAVLDNLQEAGVNTVSTTSYVAEPAGVTELGPGIRREPPEDGGRGMDRIVDRPLWGKREQFLRTGPSFEHDRSLYEECVAFAPPEPNALTSSQGHVVADFIGEAKKRGMKVYMQVAPSGRPGINPDAPQDALDLETPRLPNGESPGERMVNFPPITSTELHKFNTALVKDVLTAYPQLDGVMLDRMEQSVYSFDDAFVDFGPYSRKFANENNFDFERMRSAAQSVIDGLRNVINADLIPAQQAGGVPYALMSALRTNPAMAELLEFRAAITRSYLQKFRDSADSVRDGVELVPATFPPPISLLTGADFAKYAGLADAMMIKFFTMHWPLIVTYWTESLTRVNPSLDPGLVARAVSNAFDMEDDPSANLDDYVFPGPDDPHRAGTDAQIRKIKQATSEAGGKPILPSVHAYGPMDDVERRWRIGWEAGDSGMWINRYGYLSAEKLALLKQVTQG